MTKNKNKKNCLAWLSQSFPNWWRVFDLCIFSSVRCYDFKFHTQLYITRSAHRIFGFNLLYKLTISGKISCSNGNKGGILFLIFKTFFAISNYEYNQL